VRVIQHSGVLGAGSITEFDRRNRIELISKRVLGLNRSAVRRLKQKGYEIVSSRREGEASGLFLSSGRNYDQQRIETAS